MGEVLRLLEGGSSYLLHSNSPGYLGVDLSDVDVDKVQALKLKDQHGALITLIDHDAPAGQSGLKVNDVVTGFNGQKVENAEQLRKLLKEIPAGRRISIEISRDGNVQTMAVQLADHRAMEHDVWNKLGKTGDAAGSVPGGLGILPGNGDGSLPGGFHVPLFGSTLKVGALVEPLTQQMAEYMGVANGLMVKQVARKSEAAAAGLKAFDVILKVGSESISTSSDWERALHANQGKPVPVIVLRDKKQQTLMLQVDSKRRSAVDPAELLPIGIAGKTMLPSQNAQMAALSMSLNSDGDSAAEGPLNVGGFTGDESIKRLLRQMPMGDAAQALQEQLSPAAQGLGANGVVSSEPMEAPPAPKAPTVLPLAQLPMLTPQQMEQVRQQVLQMQPVAQPFGANQRLGQQSGLQMSRAFQQAQQQMEEARRSFNQGVANDQQRMMQMKQQMEKMRAQGFGSSN
jgi:membrane-associated protease RseP (regulator of RpoE activity)